jgi:hypothetical protein
MKRAIVGAIASASLGAAACSKHDTVAVDSAGGIDTATGDAGGGTEVCDPAPAFTGRPPAIPLIVRSPYVSTWQFGTPAGMWPSFWNGGVKAMTGIARIDGHPYVFLGAPGGIGAPPALPLTRSELTATRSTLQFATDGVALTVEFLSPIEPKDLRRQAMPVGYVTTTATATDGHAHHVSVYFDISGEWAHGDPMAPVKWHAETIAAHGGNVAALTVTPAVPHELTEVNQYPAWGTAVLAAVQTPGLTMQIGEDTVVRSRAAGMGTLDGSVDPAMPRAISDRWPVLAFDWDMQVAADHATDPAVLVIGHVRDPAIRYLGQPIAPLWKAYWPTWQEMVADALDDARAAHDRANCVDLHVAQDAMAVGGEEYAALCALSMRQAFGGTELVGTAAKPWLVLKEISSDGNVSTVDVSYPSSPVFMYANPELLRALIDPLFDYAETGGWPKPFAEHDLGTHYPNATGHNDGMEEDMPVEESADMLLMTAAYLKGTDATRASAYATAHYTILKKWADYLVPNTVDPGFQNQTDDFTGFIGHSSNLALKGILALGAMSKIAEAAGKPEDAAYYAGKASADITQWVTRSQDASHTHLKLAYDQPGTWSLKYNALFDKILGLGLIPQSVLDEETAFYRTKRLAFGIPLDNRHTYTKTDWEIWTAAWTDDATLRTQIIKDLLAYATSSPSRVPFSDWYDTKTAVKTGFQARPVVGAMFAPLVRAGRVLE